MPMPADGSSLDLHSTKFLVSRMNDRYKIVTKINIIGNFRLIHVLIDTRYIVDYSDDRTRLSLPLVVA